MLYEVITYSALRKPRQHMAWVAAASLMTDAVCGRTMAEATIVV